MVTGNIDYIGTSRPVLVIINAKTDPIGVLGPPLVAAGLTLVSCDPTSERVPDNSDDYAAVVVLGSDVNPDDDDTHGWLRAERTLLRACVDRGTPTIAVCLGAQLLAQALGAAIQRMPMARIGWFEQATTHDVASDPLRPAWPTPLRVLEWHSYSFALPQDTTLLAGTPQSVQAFRAGPCAWGFQYHLEADAEIAAHWLTVYRDDLGPNLDAQEVTDVGRRSGADRAEHGTAVAQAFANVVVAQERQAVR
jgi:GMP synthase-like glutamine amidotransferase